MNRLLFPRIILLVIFIVLTSRLYQLQLSEAATERYRYTPTVRATRYITVPPIRGEIFANDAEVVVKNDAAEREAEDDADGSDAQRLHPDCLAHLTP